MPDKVVNGSLLLWQPSQPMGWVPSDTVPTPWPSPWHQVVQDPSA